MTLFFHLFDSAWFHQTLHPALAAAWRSHSFEPCRAVCAELAPVALAFRERYARDEDEPLLSRVAAGLPFQRALWNVLVSELLLHGAAELAGVDADPETLCCLLAGAPLADSTPREQFAPIQQVLYGTRDLVFGGKPYRPLQAGLNTREDVERLASYLAGIDPGEWHAAQLESLPGLADPAERAEEVELAREWFPGLQQLFANALQRQLLIVRELL